MEGKWAQVLKFSGSSKSFLKYITIEHEWILKVSNLITRSAHIKC